MTFTMEMGKGYQFNFLVDAPNDRVIVLVCLDNIEKAAFETDFAELRGLDNLLRDILSTRRKS